jgi:hypothetical protein
METFIADLDVDLAERVRSAGLAVPDDNGPALGEGELAVWLDLGRPGKPEIQPQKNVRVTVHNAGELADILDDWWAGHAENGRQPHMHVKLPGREEYVEYELPEPKGAFIGRTLFGEKQSG